ncbi:hypothetical protein [Rathayibacter rathayi]|uniref:hypothetical protein n=1 Tax=Rathayibacter rathayi TaxID=33887 RepID=UPI0015E1EF48
MGYAHVSTGKQDTQAQRDALAAVGIVAERIDVESTEPTTRSRVPTTAANEL